MFFLRPVREDDLDALIDLSKATAHGLTTLPTDERILGRRIRTSLESFARLESEPVPGDAYLLVLADLESGRVVGTSALFSKVGGFEPFYAYRIKTSLHESKSLGVRKEVSALHLVTEHDGPTEIGTLFLLPEARRGGNGRLLSLGRFLLIAEHRTAFDETVIAELRGVIDEKGESDFWEALGRHFFDVDLPTADFFSVEDKSIIADLMPIQPIYIPLLPKAAQAVIGRVHPLTEPALHLLEAEGFHDAGMVDIFEAGPVVECPRDEIRTVRESLVARVVSIDEPEQPGEDQPEFLVTRRRDFRAAKGSFRVSDAGLEISPALARALEIEVGEEARYAPFRALRDPARPPSSASTAARPRGGSVR